MVTNEQKTGIREYAENMEVTIGEIENGRLIIKALNEGGHNCTYVDLLDVIAWVKVNRPELLGLKETDDVVDENVVPPDFDESV